MTNGTLSRKDINRRRFWALSWYFPCLLVLVVLRPIIGGGAWWFCLHCGMMAAFCLQLSRLSAKGVGVEPSRAYAWAFLAVAAILLPLGMGLLKDARVKPLKRYPSPRPS